MNKTRFGIFGCGVIARTHAQVLKEIEKAELYACADISAILLPPTRCMVLKKIL